jgi:Spy/CpxP family protein refolding chaperone
MKKILLGMVAAMIAFSSIAQNKHKSNENKGFHKGGKHFRGNENYEKLNLSNDQKAQIRTLNESFRQQMQDLKKDGISAEEQKAKRMELAKERQQKISGILTPAQREQAKDMRREYKEDRKEDKDELKEDRKENKKDRKETKRGGIRGEKVGKMSNDLNLNQDQSNKMAALNKSFRNDMKSIKENSALSQDEKKEQMKNLKQKHKSDMESLLSSGQKKQLKSQHKNRASRNAVK